MESEKRKVIVTSLFLQEGMFIRVIGDRKTIKDRISSALSEPPDKWITFDTIPAHEHHGGEEGPMDVRPHAIFAIMEQREVDLDDYLKPGQPQIRVIDLEAIRAEETTKGRVEL